MTTIRLALLAAVLSLALAMPALTATAAAPTSGRASVQAKAAACPGSIYLGGKRFGTYRHRVTCAGARRAIRDLYASYGRRGTPRGFKCRSQSKFRKTGGCTTRGGARYFGFSS
jgi:hypothetical protein